ncbi:MAG: HAD-IA family hydrolase [Desulfobacterales bacterium]|nr:HAD-IA family hydrolase [Desulfobacterales bacterium]
MIPHKPFHVKAVLFDFDGTLTEPGALNFTRIKKAIGCPADKPILEYIETLKDPHHRREAMDKLVRFEIEGAEKSVPNSGAEETISYLRSKGLRVGIISRNGRESILRALQNFSHLNAADFSLIISRDDPVRPKPNPDGILLAAKTFGINTAELLMVGDYVFDIQAGLQAGAVTVLLDNRTEPDPAMPPSDYKISRLADLKKIIRPGLPLSIGKLPNELLGEFLGKVASRDPAILIHPGIGEDTTAVDVQKEEVVVLKSDPITFVTDSIGRFAVLINANDIATSGARPRWFLTSLLFPCGTTASQIWQVMHELKTVCQQWGILLCGGHTEVTDAVLRPVVTGMLAGTVLRKDLIDKRNIQTGDVVLLSKAVAVEGTAIIAAEFGDKLKRQGLTDKEIDACKGFLESLSVLEEARLAGGSKGVVAMHDVTEGGLATALDELSIAGGHEIRVEMDKIPVFTETHKLCKLLKLDPLGLIGSGSLLICCRKNALETLLARIRRAGIRITPIGEILEKGQGVKAFRQGLPVEWPAFEVDEITRLFRPL